MVEDNKTPHPELPLSDLYSIGVGLVANGVSLGGNGKRDIFEGTYQNPQGETQSVMISLQQMAGAYELRFIGREVNFQILKVTQPGTPANQEYLVRGNRSESITGILETIQPDYQAMAELRKPR